MRTASASMTTSSSTATAPAPMPAAWWATGCMDSSPVQWARNASSIVMTEDPDGVVRVLSKGIGVGRRGRVGSAVYRDVVVRTSAGWRLAARRAELRRPAEQQ